MALPAARRRGVRVARPCFAPKGTRRRFLGAPWGRLLPLEPTANALVRTLRWEIAEEVTVRGLLWVMEYVTQIAGHAVHELGFYYAIALPENSPFLDLTREHAGVERGQDLILRWFAVDDLPGLPVFPEFLRAAVGQMPDSPQHIVQVDITG